MNPVRAFETLLTKFILDKQFITKRVQLTHKKGALTG